MSRPTTKVKEETCDLDYLPRGRWPRRRPIADEFDRECGYSYEHSLVFVRYAQYGSREYECSNCGERVFMNDYNCDPDVHEMLEVGKFELAFQPPVYKSPETLRAMAKDRKNLTRKRYRRNEEEVDLDA